MAISNEGLLVILVVGLIAGWLAGQLVQGTGFGLVGDLIIGIIGAFIGAWLLPQLGIRIGAGIVSAIVSATIGAVVLLLILRVVRRGGRWKIGEISQLYRSAISRLRFRSLSSPRLVPRQRDLPSLRLLSQEASSLLPSYREQSGAPSPR